MSSKSGGSASAYPQPIERLRLKPSQSSKDLGMAEGVYGRFTNVRAMEKLTVMTDDLHQHPLFLSGLKGTTYSKRP